MIVIIFIQSNRRQQKKSAAEPQNIHKTVGRTNRARGRAVSRDHVYFSCHLLENGNHHGSKYINMGGSPQ